MALTPGTRLGVYEVTALLGEGGMGQVYRATDTRLKRQVAIKILPPSVAADHDRLARFQREAEMLASLNHPNIAGIYGLEESGGATALVMELVEGDDLSQRIARGAIPLDEALPIAKQIAEALEAAHEQGIIHRDLKPANIKVRADGTAKVLDFGLAKAVEPVAAMSSSQSMSPTITTPAMTELGVILGTAAYMSPEQARGKAADRRTDIWGFGCVLFEMLTGRRAFDGEGVTDTLARILEREPDWTAIPPNTPASIRALLQRCLRKDPQKRLRDIADARLDIEDGDPVRISNSPDTRIHDGSSALRRRERLVWITAAFLVGSVLAAGSLAVWQRRTAATVGDSVEFEIGPAPGSQFPRPVPDFVLAPDGSHLAMVALTERGSALWVKRMDSSEYRPLPGTQGAVHPFWSPDSRQIGFFAESKLKTVGLTGDAPFEVGEATSGFYGGGGGAWNQDDVILLKSRAGPLQKVSATGGTPTAVTTLKGAETEHLWPSFLPDGQHFLFLAVGPGLPQLHVGSLTSMDPTPVGTIRSSAVYSAGHLLFVQGGLMAQPFDLRSRQLTGEPYPLSQQMYLLFGRGAYSVSETGLLGYTAPAAGFQVLLTLMDRAGKPVGTVGDQGAYFNLGLSPEDGRLAVSSRAPGGNVDVWVIDLAPGGDKIRVTTDPGGEFDPAWSSDGKYLAFNSSRSGFYSLYRRRSDGSGSDELVAEAGTGGMMAPNWSPDGKFIIFNYRQDLWIQSLEGAQKPSVFVQTPFNETSPAFSPDGRWIVYASDRTGRPELYVRPFPSKEPEQKISRDGGRFPRWRSDDEIFFLALDGMLMSARFDAAKGSLEMIPQPLFQTGLTAVNHNNPYDVATNGQRFLIPVSREPPGARPITIVTNWTARLPK